MESLIAERICHTPLKNLIVAQANLASERASKRMKQGRKAQAEKEAELAAELAKLVEKFFLRRKP